jgi:hypothetical protein
MNARRLLRFDFRRRGGAGRMTCSTANRAPSNSQNTLAMSIQYLLAIFGLKIGVTSRGLLILMVQYRADQMK